MNKREIVENDTNPYRGRRVPRRRWVHRAAFDWRQMNTNNQK